MFSKELNNVFLLVFASLMLQGYVLTKAASMPMRLDGAIVSIMPGVGNSVHDAIDTVADGG
ncbi:MAG: DUF6726 family protein [Methylobacter sp.]